MDIHYILKNYKDVQEQLENKLYEKHLVNIVTEYLPNYNKEYKQWRKEIKNESISDHILRINNIALHAIKYHRKSIVGCLYKFLDRESKYNDELMYYDKQELRSDSNEIIIPHNCDIMSCISFHRYPLGSIFEVYICHRLVSTFHITKENRYTLFKPINNISPLCILNIQYNQCKIRGVNVNLNRPIFVYGIFLSNTKRRKMVQNIITHPYDETRNYIYLNGEAEIVNIS